MKEILDIKKVRAKDNKPRLTPFDLTLKITTAVSPLSEFSLSCALKGSLIDPAQPPLKYLCCHILARH
jgi:hypothetical protein